MRRLGVCAVEGLEQQCLALEVVDWTHYELPPLSRCLPLTAPLHRDSVFWMSRCVRSNRLSFAPIDTDDDAWAPLPDLLNRNVRFGVTPDRAQRSRSR